MFSAPAVVLLDSFEGILNQKTVDYGSADNSGLNIKADNELKVCGEQSLRLEYQLHPSGYMWAARGYGLDVKGAAKWEIEPTAVKWKAYDAFSIQMHGNNSGAVIAFDIKDSGGEVWRSLLDDDFTGWKEIIIPIKNFFPRSDWQPDTAEKNEVLDYPVKSFQFEPRLPGARSHNFDCIKVIKSK